MKRLLLLLLLSLATLFSIAQLPSFPYQGNSSTGFGQNSIIGSKIGFQYAYSFTDTTAANTYQVPSSSVGFLKNMAGVAIRCGNDIYIRSNDLQYWIKQASGSSIGTVLSVGLSVPSPSSPAFSVSGSPVTTSGTLAISALGTTSQYIRGDGSLATTPSIANEWHITGNSGTTAGTNFLGTTDAQALVLKTNSTEWARLTSGGNFGIGLTPNYKFDVLANDAGVFAANIYNENTDGAGLGVAVKNSLSGRTVLQALSGSSGSTSLFDVRANGDILVPLLSSGAPTDSVVTWNATDKKLHKRPFPSSSTPTLQQVFNTETGGSVLTKNDTIAGAGFNWRMINMGITSIAQNAKTAVTGANGTANVSPLTVTGGAGGATSYSPAGTVTGGAAGTINITGGNGGAITGTPTTGIGGAGGGLTLLGGNGGAGTTTGGAGGYVEVQGGVGGNGTAGGAAGYAKIAGGSAGSTGNAGGGNVFIIPGIGNGTGKSGTTYLGVSPSYTIRGNTVIGNSSDNYTNLLQVNGSVNINKDSLAITTGKKWKVMIDTATGTLVRDSTTTAASSPAGNYGNLQINRNGVFATPASDSLNFNAGLAVKGTGSFTGTTTIGTTSSTGTVFTVGGAGVSDIFKVNGTAAPFIDMYSTRFGQKWDMAGWWGGTGGATSGINFGSGHGIIWNSTTANVPSSGLTGDIGLTRVRAKWLSVNGTNTTDSTGSLTLDTLRVKSNATVGGNFTISTAGSSFNITEGSNGRVGQTTLVSGTKAITITGLTTSSRAFVTLVTPTGVTLTTTYQAVCTANTLTIQANVAAGTINVADGSVINYFVIN